jgi:hypothetical protein
MKSFKSIREGNSVEPGVSEIDDVPEDPLSYVEIKPKKTKVVKEGIVDTAANAKVRIFSSIDRKKKELYKNAVKEDIQEAVTVKKEKYSWGKMMTVHHGSDTSYPLHPEHQQAIAKLGDGEKTSFKDETNSSVHAEREGDTVHLTRPRLSSTKTSVAHSHFNEELEQGVAEETLSELKKSTLSSYIKKAANSATMSAYGAGGESQRHAGEPVSKRPDTYGADRKVALKRLAGIGKATDRLEKNVNEEWTKTGKTGTHIASGEKTFEWAKVDSEGKKTGERHYRNAAGKVMGEETEQIAELNKDTVYSYAAKAEKDVDKKHKELISQIKTNNPLSANKTSSKIVKRYAGMDRAETRLNKEETEQGVAEGVFPKKISQKEVDKFQKKHNDKLTGREVNRQEQEKKPANNTKKQGVAEENIVETKGAPKGFHFTKDGKLKRGDADQDGNGGPMLRSDPLDKQRNKIPAVSERVDFLRIWNDIKPVHEEVKTTHEDPLVLTKDAEGHIHTHANLSVANAIHGTDVKHQAIHSGKPVQAGKFTFELSKHHEGALKEDAPFDPVAHKKEADRLMAKHIEAHKAVSKAFADIKAKGGSPGFDIPENKKLNDIKQEIRNHASKVPSGPAPKPGSPGAYYASKKPGEYTGD